jgi:hypothetical protein
MGDNPTARIDGVKWNGTRRGKFMETLRVRVVSAGCVDCRDHLLADGRELGLPLPTGEIIIVPRGWANYQCPHSGGQFQLDFLYGESPPDSDVETSAEPMSWESEDPIEVETPEWRVNLDATKNIVYPVREQGRYGSYASHDGFDDESEP